MSLSGDLYRYILSIFTDRPSRFGWLITDKLAGSGRLMTASQLAWVKKKGIKSVFTIREYPLPQSWFPVGYGIYYRHLKVENYGAPPVDVLDYAVDYIDDQITNGKPVLVHCNGKGGELAHFSNYIMKKEGLPSDQAIRKVQEIRGREIRRKNNWIH